MFCFSISFGYNEVHPHCGYVLLVVVYMLPVCMKWLTAPKCVIEEALIKCPCFSQWFWSSKTISAKTENVFVAVSSCPHFSASLSLCYVSDLPTRAECLALTCSLTDCVLSQGGHVLFSYDPGSGSTVTSAGFGGGKVKEIRSPSIAPLWNWRQPVSFLHSGFLCWSLGWTFPPQTRSSITLIQVTGWVWLAAARSA